MTLIKDGKADFIIQGNHDRYRDPCSSILYWGRQIGLNSESSMGKWEFVAKEQGGGQWIENY